MILRNWTARPSRVSMNKRHARHLCVAWTSLAAWFAASLAWADTPGEARFFAECPHRGYLELHDERRPADPHNLLYSALGLSEVEMFRAADWLGFIACRAGR